MSDLTTYLTNLMDTENKATPGPQFAYIVAELAKNVVYWNGADFVAPDQRDIREASSHLAAVLPMIAKEFYLRELAAVALAAERMTDDARFMADLPDYVAVDSEKYFSLCNALAALAEKVRGV